MHPFNASKMKISINIIPLSFLLTLIVLLSSCAQTKGDPFEEEKENHAYTNELINESSPYLLQHAHNPVNWYPWGDEALQKAKDENKMLIISVGYSACHWCHVMEHESFEDTVVAKLMNDHFISIKVDREERPDVDQVYMNAAQLISGRGGWPLNAIALSDGRPFYAGTYYPKSDWMKLLQYFVSMRETDSASINNQAEQITQGIENSELVVLNPIPSKFDVESMDTGFDKMKSTLDLQKGGRNGAPKFPMPSFWEYLLEYNHVSGNTEALNAVNTTLQSMANGGIYDHVGGGFARYSTDENWHVPHFEKMLYDNAQLVSLYTHAWQKTKNPLYKEVVEETLEYIEREMTSEEGGFYSSLDADSEGVEGKFYVWKKADIIEVLGDDGDLFCDFYNIHLLGNWEHGNNIPFRNRSLEEYVKKHKLDLKETRSKIVQAKKKLLTKRAEHIRPGLDDKILTSWNALMLKGYIEAYRAFGDEEHLKTALQNAEFLFNNAVDSKNAVNRNYKDGKSSIHGFLDDYAFLISASIELYQATFDEKWLYKARDLTSYSMDHFFDSNSGMFFYTDDLNSNLITRKMEVADNVIPASNSEMAKNLLFLGHYFYNNDYLNKAEQMVQNVHQASHKNPYYYSNWNSVELNLISTPFEVAIVGKDYKAIRAQLDQKYLPNVLFLGGKKEGSLELLESKLIPGQTTIFVCKDKTCNMPVTTVEKVWKQLE